VFENEPKFNKHFAKLNNVILSPHLAGKTSESKKRMAVMAAENILKELT
jgi:glyoxylate reductase